MDDKALKILKHFYNGTPSMQDIAYKTGATRDEVREVLRDARACKLINYTTQDYSETILNVKKKGLEKYLRNKGEIR